MTEDKKHQLDELDVTDILSYLNARVSSMEECMRREGKQLTKAKEHIENLLYYVKQCTCERSNYAEIEEDIKGAEQFLKDCEVEK